MLDQFEYNIKDTVLSRIYSPQIGVIYLSNRSLSCQISCSKFEHLRTNSKYGSAAIFCDSKAFELKKCTFFDCLAPHIYLQDNGGSTFYASASSLNVQKISILEGSSSIVNSHMSAAFYMLGDDNTIHQINVSKGESKDVETWGSGLGFSCYSHRIGLFSDIVCAECTSISLIVWELGEELLKRVAIVNCIEQSTSKQIFAGLCGKHTIRNGVFINSGSKIADISSSTLPIFSDWILDIDLTSHSLSQAFVNPIYSSNPLTPNAQLNECAQIKSILVKSMTNMVMCIGLALLYI